MGVIISPQILYPNLMILFLNNADEKSNTRAINTCNENDYQQ